MDEPPTEPPDVPPDVPPGVPTSVPSTDGVGVQGSGSVPPPRVGVAVVVVGAVGVAEVAAVVEVAVGAAEVAAASRG